MDMMIDEQPVGFQGRRGCPRASVMLRVSSEDFSVFDDTVTDLSWSGMGVLARKPLPKGSRASFDVWLPSEAEPITVAGEVAWTSFAAFGVRFLRSAPELDRYLERAFADARRI